MLQPLIGAGMDIDPNTYEQSAVGHTPILAEANPRRLSNWTWSLEQPNR